MSPSLRWWLEQRETLTTPGRFANRASPTDVCGGQATWASALDAPGRIRTCDFRLRRAALYPLSYGRRQRSLDRTPAYPETERRLAPAIREQVDARCARVARRGAGAQLRCPHGHGPRLPRHRGVGADRAAVDRVPAGAGRRRPAAVRLRRGLAAPDAAVDRASCRSTRSTSPTCTPTTTWGSRGC